MQFLICTISFGKLVDDSNTEYRNFKTEPQSDLDKTNMKLTKDYKPKVTLKQTPNRERL